MYLYIHIICSNTHVYIYIYMHNYTYVQSIHIHIYSYLHIYNTYYYIFTNKYIQTVLYQRKRNKDRGELRVDKNNASFRRHLQQARFCRCRGSRRFKGPRLLFGHTTGVGFLWWEAPRRNSRTPEIPSVDLSILGPYL